MNAVAILKYEKKGNEQQQCKSCALWTLGHHLYRTKWHWTSVKDSEGLHKHCIDSNLGNSYGTEQSEWQKSKLST